MSGSTRHDLPSTSSSLSADKLMTVLDAVPASLFWIDNGRVRCNKAAEKLIGYHTNELSSLDNFCTTLFGEAAQDVRSLFEGAPQSLSTLPSDFNLRCKDGTVRTVQFTVSDSNPTIWSMQDVTRVAERTAQLQAAILEQESFSYSVSHDLRAPLRHINSFSAILVEDYAEFLPPQGRDYLIKISKATKRMGSLIDNLLELSRVSRTVIKRSRVNLSELTTKVALMFKEIDPERMVEVDIAPDLFANCDKTLVRLLIENLFGNAWKYTGRLPAGRIEVGLHASDDGGVFYIKDNGAGFDMAYKEKMFVPFQRLHGSDFEGNGIGLATAQRIVQRHGGSIWAEGTIGEGAQFFFTIPG